VGILLLGEQSTSEPLQAPEPVRGGIYTEALVGSLQRLNPVLDFHNPVDRDIDRLIFSGLLRFDDRGIPQPELAESWGVSKDGTIYNFALRPGIQWHDGELLTSDDVLFTVELLREGGDIVPEDLQEFWREVEVVDLSAETIQFRLPEPFAPFPDYLTFGILPAHLLADLTFEEITNSQSNLHPIGSGPYRFDRFIIENGEITGVILSVFGDFYFDKPFIEQIVFLLYPDSYAALVAYQEGTVKGIGNVTPEILHDVLIEPELLMYSGRKPELMMIMFNLNNPQLAFFQEPVIRKALLMGLNRQRMVNEYLDGQGIIADGVILPGTWAYFTGLENSGFDTAAAKLLIKEEGYLVGENGVFREKEGLLFSFELIYPDDDYHLVLAEAIQRDWSLLDIEVNLTPLPYDEIVNSRLESRSFEAALVSLNMSRTPDPDPYPFWDQAQATGGQNYSQWDNRMASEYLEQARITVDLSERARLYRNFQVIFNNEMPSLPLFYSVYTYAVDREIQGVRVGPVFDSSDRFGNILDWFLVAQSPDFIGDSTEDVE
ncbi:MAG: peptide ABC transporter substrate-binding protein, partial [Anaerolineaceae bacterium]|nr:peptide ABC transporter substrate-binding protein [Anaerolineaceae bacterium]